MEEINFQDSPFHHVGNLFPEETAPISVRPDMPVLDALKIMLEKRYSQLPIVEGDKVTGIFSLWSLIRELNLAPKIKLDKLRVDDAKAKAQRVTVRDSLHSVLRQLEEHESLLVVSPHGLQAIATQSDVLRYFYQVARPYILIQEIELALRSIISKCSPGKKLHGCIKQALSKKYQKQGKELPTELNQLSFDEYRLIILCRNNWPLFENILGRNKTLTSAKLEAVRKIRNNVFHFRSSLNVLDYQTLVNVREWLVGKINKLKFRQKGIQDAEQ